jgi:hypothetical protein
MLKEVSYEKHSCARGPGVAEVAESKRRNLAPVELPTWVGVCRYAERRSAVLTFSQSLSQDAGDFTIVEVQLFAEFGGPTSYVIMSRAV